MVTVNWSDPKLRNCIALITTFDGRPERHYPSGRVERLSVDNSSNSISKTPAHIGSGRYSSEFVGNSTDDRIQLGSITSADPISFFGQTDVSVVARCNFASSNSEFPRLIDKSNNTNSADGWGIWIWRNGSSDVFRFGIDGGGLGGSSSLNPNIRDNPLRTLACNATGIPLASTATATLRTFTNGKFNSVANDTTSPFPSTTTNGAVGNWNHSTDRQWNGNIEYVALFDKPLSDAEHLAFDRNGYSFFGSRQIVYSTGSSVESAATNKLVMII